MQEILNRTIHTTVMVGYKNSLMFFFRYRIVCVRMVVVECELIAIANCNCMHIEPKKEAKWVSGNEFKIQLIWMTAWSVSSARRRESEQHTMCNFSQIRIIFGQGGDDLDEFFVQSLHSRQLADEWASPWYVRIEHARHSFIRTTHSKHSRRDEHPKRCNASLVHSPTSSSEHHKIFAKISLSFIFVFLPFMKFIVVLLSRPNRKWKPSSSCVENETKILNWERREREAGGTWCRHKIFDDTSLKVHWLQKTECSTASHLQSVGLSSMCVVRHHNQSISCAVFFCGFRPDSE